MNINEILQQVDSLYAENKGEEAEQLMVHAISVSTGEQDDESLLQLLNELLGYYRETSQIEKSYTIAERAIALAEEMGLGDSIPYATTLLNVANACRAGGKLQDSLEYYEQVREIYAKKMSGDNMLVASLENNMSLLYQEMGDYEHAKECLLTALEIVRAKGADFETAVTYANLANTIMQMGELEEAYQYAALAIREFEAMGIQDFHYGAALSAMGTYYYQNRDYVTAGDFFRKARDIMEEKLGRNEYYSRLQENISACEQMMKSKIQKGLDLCREYYETFGKPMIEKEFPEYAGKIAVGLVGEGSDCFGYDDEISRDHDWGPDFCLWVTEETYEQIGEKLQEGYAKLPREFKGFRRNVSAQGVGRRGVLTIEGFYKRLLSLDNMDWKGGTSADKIMEAIDWTQVSDAALAAVTNGEVFRDEEGIFTSIRDQILKGYPEHILYRKLAESAALFSQTGQYNYNRCKMRGDNLTAQIMLADCVKEAMKLKHYLEGEYPPHDKWLKYSLERLHGGENLSKLLQKVVEAPTQADNIIEEIGNLLAGELYAKNYISDVDSYLEVHTEELISKAFLVTLDKEQLIDRIARLEFTAFDRVQNVGGRASCQDDWPTFYVMRKSQYLTWNKTMLVQYYYDFNREYQRGHNLVEEKYGRMMESTAPMEYEQIKEHFPDISPDKQAIIEQIVALQVGWMEEFAEKYPLLAKNARSVHSEEDHLYNTSYETYLRGEISTYSDKMLELYGRYVVDYAQRDANLTFEIMANSVRLYGYADFETAERSME